MARCKSSLSTAPFVAPPATMSLVSAQANALSVRVPRNSRMYCTCDSMALSAGILTNPAVHAAKTLTAFM
eukprot:6386818-Alexandrium_andersonii.AAC.1